MTAWNLELQLPSQFVALSAFFFLCCNWKDALLGWDEVTDSVIEE